MIATVKKIIIPIIVIALLFLGYTMFLKKDDGLGLVTSSLSSDKSAEEILGNDISRALSKVNSIKLETDIFESRAYRSLVDRSQEIPPEPLGRTNPFAPLGATE